MEPAFLEVDAVLFLHDHALREYGGIQGLKSADLLDSALNRPRNKLAYAENGTVDPCALAAAYAFGIASNHAFNDGNKRTAWSCCVLFLKLNGKTIAVSAQDAVEAVVRLATGHLSEDGFAAWLRSICVTPVAAG